MDKDLVNKGFRVYHLILLLFPFYILTIIPYGRLCPQPNHQNFSIFHKKSKPPLEIVCQNSIITVTCSNAQSN